MPVAFLNETIVVNPPSKRPALTKSPYVASATEAMKNYTRKHGRCRERRAGICETSAGQHGTVRISPSYEVAQNSNRVEMCKDDLRHVNGPGVLHTMELSLQKYIE